MRYWAGVRAAAGIEQESFRATTVAEALRQARGAHPDPEFSRVLGICSLLRDGRRIGPEHFDEPLATDVLLEALPPFAGG